jgi:hypothetical protein
VAIRFTMPDRTVSVPWSAFSRWEFSEAKEDMLVLESSRERIVIRGQRLAVLRDALDSGMLSEVRQHSGKTLPGDNAVTVREIAFTRAGASA